MERQIRSILWISLFIGFGFALAIGIAAGDRGMITGALAAFVGGILVAPFVARMWR